MASMDIVAANKVGAIGTWIEKSCFKELYNMIWLLLKENLKRQHSWRKLMLSYIAAAYFSFHA